MLCSLDTEMLIYKTTLLEKADAHVVYKYLSEHIHRRSSLRAPNRIVKPYITAANWKAKCTPEKWRIKRSLQLKKHKNKTTVGPKVLEICPWVLCLWWHFLSFARFLSFSFKSLLIPSWWNLRKIVDFQAFYLFSQKSQTSEKTFLKLFFH